MNAENMYRAKHIKWEKMKNENYFTYIIENHYKRPKTFCVREKNDHIYLN